MEVVRCVCGLASEAFGVGWGKLDVVTATGCRVYRLHCLKETCSDMLTFYQQLSAMRAILSPEANIIKAAASRPTRTDYTLPGVSNYLSN